MNLLARQKCFMKSLFRFFKRKPNADELMAGLHKVSVDPMHLNELSAALRLSSVEQERLELAVMLHTIALAVCQVGIAGRLDMLDALESACLNLLKHFVGEVSHVRIGSVVVANTEFFQVLKELKLDVVPATVEELESTEVNYLLLLRGCSELLRMVSVR